MPCSSSRLRRCSSCDKNCRCGCQSNIYSLPWEVIEQILQYENPISLLSIERSCKFFFAAVSHYWQTYCRRNNLTQPPTPLCVSYDVNEASFYSYDKAVQLADDPGQRWRTIAVRSYLYANNKCVFCRSASVDDGLAGKFRFSHDVLLCIRCLSHFTVNITHDTIHIFKDNDIDSCKLHIPFGPILLSTFITKLRSQDYDERAILDKIQPRFGNSSISPSSERLSTIMPLALTLNVESEESRRGNICTLYNKQQGCSCVIKDCSSSRDCHGNREQQQQQRVGTITATNVTRKWHFYAISSFVLIFNIVQLIHSSVIIPEYQHINIGGEQIASFVLLAFIDISLIAFSSAYVLINFIRRLSKRDWNQSFATILQCFMLACFIVEGLQSILISTYCKDIQSNTNELFVKGIPQYTSSTSQKGQIDWVQRNFQCCGFTQNSTADWLIFSNTSATSSLPASCCSTLIGHNECSVVESFAESCPIAVEDYLSGLMRGFMCTTVCCCVIHVFFMAYVCGTFHFYRSRHRETNSDSELTIFSMA